MNITDKGNIFDRGCLVQLSIGVWGGAKKIDEAKAKEALGSDWAKARKLLVDREALKPIERVRNEARGFIRSLALPFPVDGVLFIPFSVVTKIDERLQGFKAEFDFAVMTFCTSYPGLVQAAQASLGELYSEADYPEDVEQFFKFEWRFITLSAPGENQFLSPELVAREQGKFIKTMEEARQMGVVALREEFAQIVERCRERLAPGEDGERKKFKRSLTGNFVEFFESFQERNIFNDGELQELVAKAKGIVEGVEFEELRDDEALRENVKKAMDGVGEELEKAIESMPGRRLKVD